MPIKSSPAPLAISEIATEFGDSTPNQMSEFYRGGSLVNDVATNSGVPASGAIDIGDFYGAGNAVIVAASAGTNIDVAPLFASPDTFTNAVSKVLTIAAPIAINGNNVALTVPSNLAGTLDIQNAGTITGSRGNGGNAGSGGNGGNGSAGGAAISVQANGVTLNNSGTVQGGGGGGGGGAAGAPSSGTVNFGNANYSPTRQWNQPFGLHGAGGPPSGKFVAPQGTFNYGPQGNPNTTSISQTSPPGTGTMNRGNPLGDPGPTGPHTKRWNVGGGSYSFTTSGGNGGGGGNGFGFDGSSIVNPQSGQGGSSPGGANGGAGGAAGAAGVAGSNSPAFTGGSAGAGGNSLTSPGSVNYSVSNTGTINGTQG